MDAEDLLVLFDQWQDEVRREVERQGRYSQALNSVVVVGALVAGVQGQLLGETLNLKPWTLRAQACNSIAFLGLVAEVAGTFFGAVNAVKLQRRAQRGTGALDRMDQCKGNLKILIKYVANQTASKKPSPTGEGGRINTNPFAPRPQKPMRGMSYAESEPKGPHAGGFSFRYEDDPDLVLGPSTHEPPRSQYPPHPQPFHPRPQSYYPPSPQPYHPPQPKRHNPFRRQTPVSLRSLPQDPVTDGNKEREDITPPAVSLEPSLHGAAAEQEEEVGHAAVEHGESALAVAPYSRRFSGTPEPLDANEEPKATPAPISSNAPHPSGLEGSHLQQSPDGRTSNYPSRPPSRNDDDASPVDEGDPSQQPRWRHKQAAAPQASTVFYNGVTFIENYGSYTSIQDSNNHYSTVTTYSNFGSDKGDHWIETCDKVKDGLKDIGSLFGLEGSEPLRAGIDGIIEQVYEFQRGEGRFVAIAAKLGTEEGSNSGQRKPIHQPIGKKLASPLGEISLEIVSLVSMGFGVVCLATSVILFAAARADILGNQVWALCVTLLLAVTLFSVLPFIPLISMRKLTRAERAQSAA